MIEIESLPLPRLPGQARGPRLSPDGNRIAVRFAPRGGIYVGESDREATRVLIDGGNAARWPIGWLDKEWILYASLDEMGNPSRVGAVPASGDPRCPEVPGQNAVPLGNGAALVAGASHVLRWEPKRGLTTRLSPLAPRSDVPVLTVSADGTKFACSEVIDHTTSLIMGSMEHGAGGRRVLGPIENAYLVPAYAGSLLLCLQLDRIGMKIMAYNDAGRAERLVLQAVREPAIEPLPEKKVEEPKDKKRGRWRNKKPEKEAEAPPSKPPPRLPWMVASPDGKRIALLRGEQQHPMRPVRSDIWLIELETGNAKRLTTSGGFRHGLAWPEPYKILVVSDEGVSVLPLPSPEPEPQRKWGRRAPRLAKPG